MAFDSIKFKESENIIPFCLENKERYYHDLINIENSWTSRLDAIYSNEFFREAIQLIINSIVLFEKGYFDCAFYSLRQSMEISTTIIYFVDSSEEKSKSEMKKWKNEEKFPMNKRMLDELENRKLVFANIKEEMSVFFNDVELTKQKLNKYVHKQGLDKFYVSRIHPLKKGEKENLNKKLLVEYNNFLIKTIGTIAVFRLAIDPFPLLLADESIYKRTRRLMTEGYSDEFIEKYIGNENISAYKLTDMYKGIYETIIKEEEMLPSVLDVVKDDFIDRNNIKEIYSQFHILSPFEKIAVTLVGISEKISNIFFYKGLSWYSTNTKSKKISSGFHSKDLTIIKDKEFNVGYDEVFLSRFEVYSEMFHIEHNEKFDPIEISQINLMIDKFNKEYQQLQDNIQNT